MNHGIRPAACEISCGIFPSARWCFARKRRPCATPGWRPDSDIANELIAASPPKNQPKPGRRLSPDGPQPATRPQPRSRLHTVCSSRLTLAQAKARSSRSSGVSSTTVSARRRSACSRRSRYSASALPIRRRYRAATSSRGAIPATSAIGIISFAARCGSTGIVNVLGASGRLWAGWVEAVLAQGEPRKALCLRRLSESRNALSPSFHVAYWPPRPPGHAYCSTLLKLTTISSGR